MRRRIIILALIAACSDDAATTPACTTSTPLEGAIFGETFAPTASRARFSTRYPGQLDVLLREHPVDCSESGSTPQEDFAQMTVFIPKALQVVGAPRLGDRADTVECTAIRVTHPGGTPLTQQASAADGTLCVTAIDDAHIAGAIEIDLEDVTAHGVFEATICR